MKTALVVLVRIAWLGTCIAVLVNAHKGYKATSDWKMEEGLAFQMLVLSFPSSFVVAMDHELGSDAQPVRSRSLPSSSKATYGGLVSFRCSWLCPVVHSVFQCLLTGGREAHKLNERCCDFSPTTVRRLALVGFAAASNAWEMSWVRAKTKTPMNSTSGELRVNEKLSATTTMTIPTFSTAGRGAWLRASRAHKANAKMKSTRYCSSIAVGRKRRGERCFRDRVAKCTDKPLAPALDAHKH